MLRTRTALGLLGLGVLATPAALAGTTAPHLPAARGGATMTTEPKTAPSTEPAPAPSPPAGTPEALHTALARRWSEELWGRGDLAVADEIIAPDYVRHDAGDPFPARGPDDVKRIVRMLRAMLPDLRIEIEDLVAAGDRVVTRYTGVATDTAGYLGRPPPAGRSAPRRSRSSASRRPDRRELGRARRPGHPHPARPPPPAPTRPGPLIAPGPPARRHQRPLPPAAAGGPAPAGEGAALRPLAAAPSGGARAYA